MKRSEKTNRIGTAGWSLSRNAKPYFPGEGSHLDRYAQQLNAVEINTTFYRHHEAKTFLKWAEAVPADFQFSVKLSREVTHDARFDLPETQLKEIVQPYLGLGKKLGVILIQLPPSFIFEKKKVETFFKRMRKITDLPLACEPRHLTWTSDEAFRLFQEYGVTKVKADPELCSVQSEWDQCGLIQYHRLHGTPVVYRSAYSKEFLNRLSEEIKTEAKPTWVIFDNTAESHATANALYLIKMI